MLPLRKEGILSEQLISKIFGNITVIQGVNMNILMELEEVAKQGETHGAGAALASRIFEDACEALKVYAEYTSIQDKAMRAVSKLMSRNKEFSKFCESARKQPLTRSLDLGAFLVKPLQRLCKYPLLFKELLRSTKEDDIDYLSIQLTLQKISKIVTFVNDRQREVEEHEKVRKIDKKTGNKMPQTEDRKLIWEEKRQIYVAGKGPKDWSVYLFSDLVLVTEEISEKKQKVRCMVPFDEYTVVNQDESKGSGVAFTFPSDEGTEHLCIICITPTEQKQLLEKTQEQLNNVARAQAYRMKMQNEALRLQQLQAQQEAAAEAKKPSTAQAEPRKQNTTSKRLQNNTARDEIRAAFKSMSVLPNSVRGIKSPPISSPPPANADSKKTTNQPSSLVDGRRSMIGGVGASVQQPETARRMTTPLKPNTLAAPAPNMIRKGSTPDPVLLELQRKLNI